MAVFAPIPKARVITAIAVNPGFFSSIRRPYLTSCPSVCIASFQLYRERPDASFIAKRNQWVHARTPPRGQITRREGNQSKQKRRSDKCRWIIWCDLIELGGKRPSRAQRNEHAHRNTDQRQLQSVADDHAHHLRRTCSQGHSSSDLMDSL